MPPPKPMAKLSILSLGTMVNAIARFPANKSEAISRDGRADV